MYRKGEAARRAAAEEDAIFDEILGYRHEEGIELGRERFLLDGRNMLSSPSPSQSPSPPDDDEDEDTHSLSIQDLTQRYMVTMKAVADRMLLRDSLSRDVAVAQADQFLIYGHDDQPVPSDEDNRDGPMARLQQGGDGVVTQVDVLRVAERLQEQVQVFDRDTLVRMTLERTVPVFLKNLERSGMRPAVVIPRDCDDMELWFFLKLWPSLMGCKPHVVADLRELTSSFCAVHVIPGIWDDQSIRECVTMLARDRGHVSLSMVIAGVIPKDLSPSALKPPHRLLLMGTSVDTFGDVVGLPLHLYPLIHDVRAYRIPPRLERAPADFQHLLGQFPKNPKTPVAVLDGYLPRRYHQHPCVTGFHPLRLSQWCVDMSETNRVKPMKFIT